MAPLIPIDGRDYSFLELQLARLTAKNNTYKVKAINIMTGENTAETAKARIGELRLNNPRLSDTLDTTSVLTRQAVPRIVPMAKDLQHDKKFAAYSAQHTTAAQEFVQNTTNSAGDILFINGAISTKPPGHLSVVLHYIHHCLKNELHRGIELAFFHIGEDTAAKPDARLLSYALQSNAVATFEVVASANLQKGYLIDADHTLRLAETAQNLGVKKPFYLNTSRVVLNTKHLACFLAGSVPAYMGLSETQLRQIVAEKITDKLIPLFEIKPVQNYTHWAGQFAFVIGQMSQVVPTAFVVRDAGLKQIFTFKTPEELTALLPVIQREYAPYVRYLKAA